MWIDKERLIHSFKTALGCLLGFAMTKALHAYLFFDQWLIVTILVVMCAQISVGSIVFKSSIRFIGTCIGSLLAAVTIISFGDNPLVFAAVIALAGMAFSYLATGQQSYSDAGTLGAVTTAIILINPNPTLALAAERFFEITIGIIIATVISQCILPIHARNHLRRNQAQTLGLLKKFFQLATANEAASQEQIQEVDELIIQSLATQRKLAKEAKRELLGSKFEPERFKKMLESEKKILRSIDFLNQLYGELKLHDLLKDLVEWKRYNELVVTAFDKITQRIENPEKAESDIEVPSITALKNEVTQQASLNAEDLKEANALFFCLDKQSSLMTELALLVR